jgi:hypothetical protein
MRSRNATPRSFFIMALIFALTLVTASCRAEPQESTVIEAPSGRITNQ